MKMTPTAVIEVIVVVPLLHIMIEAEANVYPSGDKFTNFGHTKKSQGMEHKPILLWGLQDASEICIPQAIHSQVP
jgi:hypothetical protein